MDSKGELDNLIEKAANLIVDAKKVVVFTGAGISTESGIPDFRSPGTGMWNKYDPDMFTYQRFVSDPDTRRMVWQLLSGPDFIHQDVQPNAAHYAITELEEMGKLDCVITQNVDGLHEWALNLEAGTPAEKVIHLHGTMQRAKCLNCGKTRPLDEVRQWIDEGRDVADCPNCGGLLKPDAVFFGEAMPVRETMEAERHSRACDLCLVIGSSLVVYPAAFMPGYALQSGAKLVIINRMPTHMDHSAHVCIHEAAGETMSRVMERVRSKL